MNFGDAKNRCALVEWLDLMRDGRRQYLDKAKAKFPALPQNMALATIRLKHESEAHAVVIREAIAYFSREERWPDNLAEEVYFYLDMRVSFASLILWNVLEEPGPDSGREVFATPEIIGAVTADSEDFTRRMLIEVWDRFGDVYLRQWLAQPAPDGE